MTLSAKFADYKENQWKEVKKYSFYTAIIFCQLTLSNQLEMKKRMDGIYSEPY